MLGDEFTAGIDDYRPDLDAAAYYYKRACEEGMAIACSRYGSHLRSDGKTDAEKRLGTEYFGKACDLGDRPACHQYVNLVAEALE